ncbi:MAG: hydroxylamine oxidoreductase [Magnetococcales bacterium]|nr:hydroxylamine oxidoreductase [Magnetococcales bacterium]MBF0115222.1 hydroxylamine oxidoreductase [Magnetococcales bacterium]
MRITHLQAVIWLLFWPWLAWSGLPEGAQGVGENAEHWQPDAMHEYWDPATYHRPETERMVGVYTGEECVECHAGVTPGIVKEWRSSRHAQAASPVSCPACHGGDHQKLTFPTPQTCGACHPQRLAQMEEEKKYGFPSHALAMERAVDSKHFADKPKAEVAACLQCHSVATKCDSCHTRHRFDPAEARRPEACQTCHSGPPHPDDLAYFSSPHGQLYQKEGATWDWSKPLRKGNYQTPTCAYCHMKDGNHQVADKAVWKFGIREVNPKTAENEIKRKRWRETCADCHPEETARNFFRDLDAERQATWKQLYGVERLLKSLRSDGLLRPSAADRPSYPMDWLARWLPRERIGFYEGQASAFYNVSAIERDYFDLWYFTNLGAYKGMAHGAKEMAHRFHKQLDGQARSIAQTAEALRKTGKAGQQIDLKPLWLEGEYTRFNRDHN